MIELKNINKIYKRNKKQIHALKDINLIFKDNGFVSITGPSGSGKTTLLNLIYGSVIPTSGEIYYNKTSFKNKKVECCSYIFQEYNLLDDLTVFDNLNLSLKLNGIEKTKEEIEEVLKKLGLDDVLNAYPYELSGGQQQRVAIARASLTDAKIILADEPTGALDEEAAIEVMNLLKQESKNKLVIVVSHNKNLISNYADYKIEMIDGKIVENIDSTQTSYIDNKVIEKRKKNGISYLFKLGFKYNNYNSIKFYLSIIMMVISFTLFLLSIALMNFNPQKNYDSINDKKYNYTIITKEESNNSFTKHYVDFEIDEFEFLDKTFVFYENYTFTNGNSKHKCNSIIVFNDIIKNLDFKIVGEYPKENEILITKKILDDLNTTDYSNVTYRDYKVSGYIEIDYIKKDNDVVDLNDAIYVFNYSNKNPYFLLTNKLNYSTVESVNNMSGEQKYSCESVLIDSVLRATIFADELNKIGIPLSVTMIVLTFLILINYIFSIIELNRKNAQIIKMIGGNNLDLSIIFGILPLITIVFSLIASYVLYFVIKYNINLYIVKEFNILLPILHLSLVKNILIILSVITLFLLSTLLPLIRIKYIK